MVRRSLLVLLSAGAAALAAPSAPADAESRLHAKARQITQRHAAALERRDWSSVCRYLSSTLRFGMIKTAREKLGMKGRRCADAARLMIDPRMSRFRIHSIDGRRPPIWLEITWELYPKNPTVVRIGRGKGVRHWVYLEYPVDPLCRYCGRR